MPDSSLVLDNNKSDREILLETRQELRFGFKEMHRRLDELNGAVARHEKEIRLQEKEQFEARRQRDLTAQRLTQLIEALSDHKGEDAKKPSVMKAVVWIGIVLGVVQAAIGFTIYLELLHRLSGG